MKWSWSVALLCALPVHGAIHELDIEPEVQRHSELCWAAVSVMATRAFPESETYRPATQEEVVLYTEAGLDTLAASGASEPQIVEDKRTACGVDYAGCNRTGQPLLLGLDRDRINKVAPGLKRMLSPEHFRMDIGVRKAPIIIRWFYTSSDDCDNEEEGPPRFGMHALIVTGYDDVTKEIRVWDPWPEHNQAEPSGHVRHKWLSMKRYEHPVNDNGSPVRSSHGFDVFAIRLRGQSAATSSLGLKQIPPVPPCVHESVAIMGGTPDVRQVIDGVMHGLVVRAENGSILQGPFEAGSPFPILALRSADVDLKRASPERLFLPQTKALVVPVLQAGRVVESFLLLHGRDGWVEGGYSNNQIAKLLVDVRRDRSSPQRSAAGFYLVSIPEEGSFFAAHGFMDQADLISLANGARGGFVPARQALTGVLGQIDRRKNGTGHVERPQ